MRRKKILIIGGVVLGIFIILHIYFNYLYVYRGKVIDADTKEPIEGAVVVASWHEEGATPAGPTSRFKDVKETLTDKNGKWRINGPKGDQNLAPLIALITFSYYTRPPEFIVFKPGYCSLPAGFGIKACEEKMKVYNFTRSNNIGEMVELPKLITREDRRRSLPSPIHRDGNGKVYAKQGAFIKLINEESHNLGIGEYDTLKGYEK